MSGPNSSASPSFIPAIQGGPYSNASSPLVNVQPLGQGFNGQPQFHRKKTKQKKNKMLAYFLFFNLFLLAESLIFH